MGFCYMKEDFVRNPECQRTIFLVLPYLMFSLLENPVNTRMEGLGHPLGKEPCLTKFCQRLR